MAEARDTRPAPGDSSETVIRSTKGRATTKDEETVVEIGPDGGAREWRVGSVEINPISGEVESEWGMGRV